MAGIQTGMLGALIGAGMIASGTPAVVFVGVVIVAAGTAYAIYKIGQALAPAVGNAFRWFAEHTSKSRPSTKGKHQTGQARRGRDRGNEKGDSKRGYPNKKPDNWKGPWPPK